MEKIMQSSLPWPMGVALGDLIATTFENMTVSLVIAKYAPSDDNNDPDKYTRVICGWAGITPTTFVRDLPRPSFLIYVRRSPVRGVGSVRGFG